MIKQSRVPVWDNIRFFLMMAVVVSHFADTNSANSSLSRSVFMITFSFHMPLFFYISGVFHKNVRITEKIVSYLSIYVVLKITMFLLKDCFGKRPSFSVFTEAAIPWFMFALAVFIGLSYLLRNIPKGYILLISFLLGCFSGYDQTVGDQFMLSRIIVFYPYYLLGMITPRGGLENLTQKKVLKIVGLAVIVLWCWICFAQLDKIYFIRPLLTGRNPFNNTIAEAGWRYRLCCYCISVIIGFSFLIAVPTGQIRWISVFGQRTIQVYFWHNLLRYILIQTGIYENYFTGSLLRRASWILLAIPLTFVLSTKIFSFPTQQLMHPMTYRAPSVDQHIQKIK